jgi:hypothetical protein
MRNIIRRLALFLVVVVAVADAPLFGQRPGGPNPAGRQGGPDVGGRAAGGADAGGRGGGRAAGAGGAQDGRGRGRGPELRTGTSSIRGRVVSATTGTPVRRAQIQATFYTEQGGRGEPPRNTTTDNNGAFQFANLPAGRWSLRAAKSGFVDQQFGQRSAFASVDPVSVAEGQTITADFRLSRGGAFSGRVVDEFGDPIAGASISALRYQVTAQGIRTSRTGTSVPSDDTGAYRVYGLPPGQYYISMSDPSARNVIANLAAELGNVQGGVVNLQLDAASLAFSARDVINGSGPNTTSYAPTYYPGTASLADAQRLTLGLGDEQSGINLAVVPVRTARISGRVVGSNGSATSANITLANRMGQSFNVSGGRGSAGDGAFTIANVPPGSYTLDVVGPNAGGMPAEVASMPIVVSGGEDIAGLQITLGSGGRISGSMVSDNGSLPASTTRIVVAPLRGTDRSAMVNASGTFDFEGLLGIYTMRFESLPNGYMVKSITANGVDVSDAAIEFRPGDRVSMRVELTDRITQVSGTVRAKGSLNGATVVIFPDEPEKWTSTSRFIKTARPTEGGQFTVRGLPPHSRYLAVAVEFIEPGEAQSPEFLQRAKKAASATFGLSAGDQRILDLPVVTR